MISFSRSATLVSLSLLSILGDVIGWDGYLESILIGLVDLGQTLASRCTAFYGQLTDWEMRLHFSRPTG